MSPRVRRLPQRLVRFVLVVALVGVGLGAPLVTTSTPASAAAVFQDGSIKYSQVINCFGIIQGAPYAELGAGAYVGSSVDFAAARPALNETFYVHLVVGALGNACSGQFVNIQFSLPSGVTPAITGASPVVCQYSGEAATTSGPCPQTAHAGTTGQYWLPNLANPNAVYMWPLPQGKLLEIKVPVRSTTPQIGQNFTGFFQLVDGNDSPLLTATAPVNVFAAGAPSGSTGTPSITYPSPSATLITQTTAKSTGYLQPQRRAGNAYLDLSTSPSMSPLVTTAGPAAVPGDDPDGYTVWSDWSGLTSGTTYYWRLRFQPNGGSEVVGATQTFTTLPGNQATIGDGTSASCTAGALQSALAGPATVIRFNCGTMPVTIEMSTSLAINRALTIDGDDLVTLRAPSGQRHFAIDAGVGQVFLTDLALVGHPSGTTVAGCGGAVTAATGVFLFVDSSRVTGNRATRGGALCGATGSSIFVRDASSVSGNVATDSGGGIYSTWAVAVTESEVSGNTATNSGGGLVVIGGVSGGLTVERSTIANNVAGAPSNPSALGGGMLADGYILVAESTLSANTAGDGAAIAITGSGYSNLRGSTIAGNVARASTGGAVWLTSSAPNENVANTLFSANTPRACSNASGAQSTASSGGNQDSGTGCTFLDQATDRLNAPVRLAPLGFNGGPTRTHLPLAGSSAIDGGVDGGCAPNPGRDQRGVSIPNVISGTTRKIDSDADGVAKCDVGAVELKPDGVAPTVAGIDRLDDSPTGAASVRWRVRFSEPVSGVDTADLALVASGISGAVITTVTAEATAPTVNWLVTATTGTGSGTLRLDVGAGATIRDATNVALAAAASGSTYTLSRPAGGGGGGGGGAGGGGGYTSLVPARLADTRVPNATVDGAVSGGGHVPAGGVLRVPIAGRGGVPAGATSVSLNVTIVDPLGAGYATVWPCDEAQPNASNLNYQSGTIPNAVLTKLAGDGSVCIYSYSGAHVLVDVNGAFGAGAQYSPLVPARLADTRVPGATIDGAASGGGAVGAGQTFVVPVRGRGGVPGGATAVSLNVTAVDPLAPGYATVWPCDEAQPNASNLNYQAGSTIPNAVLTKLAGDGSVCVFTSSTTHLLVDVNGSFTGTSTFLSLVPARVADTRVPNATIDGVLSGTGVLGAGQALVIPIAGRGGVPAGARAVSLNVTAVDPIAAGYATVWPCDQAQPNASNLNFGPDQTIPNAVLTRLAGDGSVCVFTSAPIHLLVDVNGAL